MAGKSAVGRDMASKSKNVGKDMSYKKIGTRTDSHDLKESKQAREKSTKRTDEQGAFKASTGLPTGLKKGGKIKGKK